MLRSMSCRSRLAGASTLVVCAAAGGPAWGAVAITSSTTTTFIGQSVTLKVSSTNAGPLTIRQLRADRMQGPGRCSVSLPTSERYIGGKTQKTVPYPTAGQVVTVKLAASTLEYFGGDPFAGLFGDPDYPERCDDYVSQFTRISAWQPAPTGGYDVAHKALVRLL